MTPDSMPGVLPRASIAPGSRKPRYALLALHVVELRLELL
jgi:hypothetical protein